MIGCAPYAPHLYLPYCLDDNDPAERAVGMRIGQEFLKICDEVWQWGETVSEGMAAELALARKLGIPIEVFPGGVYDRADAPKNVAACKKAGKAP